MRALVHDRPGGPLTVRDVPEPTAPPGGVVVEVHATGLCRSDWHAWAGHEEVPLPHIPGHELAGVVVEVGDGVQLWRPGDRVTVPFVEGCGRCEWCERGDAQVCPDQQQPGFTHAGSFAELVALHAADTNLVGIPHGVSMRAAASLGCRFATAYRGLVARARLREGEWLAVVGAGGVGLSAVMIAAAIGARVVAIDTRPAALAEAGELGAEHLITVGDDDDAARLAAQVQELTGGAQVSVDALGSEHASSTAILSLRRRGRHVQIGLLPPLPDHPRLPMERVIAWELDVLGSHGMSANDYPEMLRQVAEGKLDPHRLLGRLVTLEEAATLLPTMDTAAPVGVTVIDPHRL